MREFKLQRVFDSGICGMRCFPWWNEEMQVATYI